MQYEILCKHCHKKFAIESEGGETLRCKCPYCSNQLIVATPSAASPEEAIAPPHQPHRINPSHLRQLHHTASPLKEA